MPRQWEKARLRGLQQRTARDNRDLAAFLNERRFPSRPLSKQQLRSLANRARCSIARNQT